tara:strand:- start:213 stop:527 length:315 start_codon:yes stop_codon:yes gene_type:complete
MRLVIAAALLLLATPVLAEPPCSTRDRLLTDLGVEGKAVVAGAITHTGDMMEIVANPAGEFTVILTYPNGLEYPLDGGLYIYDREITCIVTHGQGWQLMVGERV